MLKRRVRVTFEIDVNLPSIMSEEQLKFMVEENSCPGTGFVGAALDKWMDDHSARGVCWGCSANGKNELLPLTDGPRV